jgi:hypothetical protein
VSWWPFDVADRDPAPAVRGADHGGEHQLHRGLLVGEPADDLGAAAFLDKRALGQVRGPDPNPVRDRDLADGQQRVQVVLEAGRSGRVIATY